MKINWLKYILLSGMLLYCGVCSTMYAGGWETLKTERSDARQVAKDEGVEIKTARLTIVINVNRPTSVKVYTILGQLISSETVPAGVSQLHLPSHGVYIVKTGSLTCKVAL